MKKEEKTAAPVRTPGLAQPRGRGIRNSGVVTELKKDEVTGETVVVFELAESPPVVPVQPLAAAPPPAPTGPSERKTILSPAVNINGKMASVGDIKPGDRVLFTGDPATQIDVERDEEDPTVNPSGLKESEAKEQSESDHKREVAAKKHHHEKS